ncbi:MAG: prolipoprotein diacylglyceryl transferase [Pseudomonadota bacterium]
MQAALNFPDISPDLISFTVFGIELALRWYALAYLAGILIGWRLLLRHLRRPALWPHNTAPASEEQIDLFLTWAILGIILGGRLGFVLFYQPQFYLENPGQIIRIDQGGMAFHGGLLGVVVAALIFARRHQIPALSFADALAIATPVGIGLGRLANFINAELWGRPSDVAWAVIFPGLDAQNCPGPEGLVEQAGQILCARHPSQLYEAALEGLVLTVVLLILAARGGLKRPGLIAGVFFAGYGAARIFVENYREADAQFLAEYPPFGHVVSLGEFGLSMGQVLSLPMLCLGLAMIAWSALGRKDRRADV